MKLSIVLFLRALLFFALSTSLADGAPMAGAPVTTEAEDPKTNFKTKFIPLVEEDTGYLTQYADLDIGWTWGPGLQSQVSRFLFVF